MSVIKSLALIVAVSALAVSGMAFPGCKSANNNPSPNGNSSPTMSGTGGGNGSMGEDPSHAMHGNPADSQPAK